MNTIDTQDDRFDDPAIVSGIRFHNLCLAGHGGVDRRSEIWRIETPNAIAFQRGDDRLVVINKPGEVFPIHHLETLPATGNLQGSATWLADAGAIGSQGHPLGTCRGEAR
jgi:hypothetical protein